MRYGVRAVWKGGFDPLRAHEWDAGADLRAATSAGVEPQHVVMVGTNVRVEIPQGFVGLLFARSSLSRLGLMLANGVGVIDHGYTGEVMVPLANVGRCPVAVRKGERIAQLVIVPCLFPDFIWVDKLDETERGAGGSLAEWWCMLQELVTGEVDFPDTQETFLALADLIEPIEEGDDE